MCRTSRYNQPHVKHRYGKQIYQKHTDTNLDLEVNTAVEKILTDWNDDSIIMNPAINALLYRET